MSRLIGGLLNYVAPATGVYSINNVTSNIMGGKSWPIQQPPDAYSAYVVSWLNIGESSVTDRAPDTTISYVGTGASVSGGKLLLPGTGGILVQGDNIPVLTQPYCYEILAKATANPPNPGTLIDTRGTDFSAGLSMYFSSASQLTIYNGTLPTVSISNMNTTEVIHYAITRGADGVSRAFVRGVLASSGSSDFGSLPSAECYIGQNGFYAGGAYYFTGEVLGFKLTKGVPRYTENFTPPEVL